MECEARSHICWARSGRDWSHQWAESGHIGCRDHSRIGIMALSCGSAAELWHAILRGPSDADRRDRGLKKHQVIMQPTILLRTTCKSGPNCF